MVSPFPPDFFSNTANCPINGTLRKTFFLLLLPHSFLSLFFFSPLDMNHENEPLIGSSGHHNHHDVTFFSSFKTTMTSSYFNILLIFVPAALIASYSNASDTVVFSLNFLAIIPLAKLLGFGKEQIPSFCLILTLFTFILATEEIALRTGSTIGAVSDKELCTDIRLTFGIYFFCYELFSYSMQHSEMLWSLFLALSL